MSRVFFLGGEKARRQVIIIFVAKVGEVKEREKVSGKFLCINNVLRGFGVWGSRKTWNVRSIVVGVNLQVSNYLAVKTKITIFPRQI